MRARVLPSIMPPGARALTRAGAIATARPASCDLGGPPSGFPRWRARAFCAVNGGGGGLAPALVVQGGGQKPGALQGGESLVDKLGGARRVFCRSWGEEAR